MKNKFLSSVVMLLSGFVFASAVHAEPAIQKVKHTKSSFVVKYDRDCLPEAHKPRNASCSKDKIDSKWFQVSVREAEQNLRYRTQSLQTELQSMISKGVPIQSVIAALNNLGYTRQNIVEALVAAGVTAENAWNLTDTKKPNHNGGNVATNGGNAGNHEHGHGNHNDDGHTVSCVRA